MASEPRLGNDQRWMLRALELAELGPSADPNPRVGCVLVRAQDGGEVEIGAGFHRGAGTPHAEAAALREAGELARGATAYVTLEPCNHTGRTGPCAEALIAAGVTRVVHAASDPNPDARGGARTLRSAGVDVTSGVLADQAEALNESWAFSVQQGRPRVIWKFAGSLDGRSAAHDGTSQWLTGTSARLDVHRLRANCQAIVVGTGTALFDNPRLTIRDAKGEVVGRQPLRVVVGNRSLPADAHLHDGTASTVQIRSHDPAEVLQHLHARDIRSVWLEGGPTLAGAFLRAGLIDEVIVYLAPVLLGAGRAAVDDFGVATLADAPRFTLFDLTQFDDDVRARYRPAEEAV